MWGKPHDSVGLNFRISPNLVGEIISRYREGLSLRQIALETGISKTAIRGRLIQAKISLRPSCTKGQPSPLQEVGKRSAKPPYGFAFLEGRLVRHPDEYPVFNLIHQKRKSGMSVNSIATWLNGKGIPSPMKRQWSWASVRSALRGADVFNLK